MVARVYAERDPQCDGSIANDKASRSALSAQLLHHDPVALNFVQIKLDRCGRLGSRYIGRLDLAEDFTLAAKQDYAPAAFHPARELGGAVFLAGGRRHHSSRTGNAQPVRAALVHSLDQHATNVGATALFGESGGAYFALGSHPKETKKSPAEAGH
jgi:hypothetical protein